MEEIYGYKVKSSTFYWKFISMFTLSFLAVFREGAETILFYAGIMPLISTSNLLIGIALAIVALIIIGIIMVKASGKLPISKVFLVLSWLIYILGFKMLGVSIHALQITDMLSKQHYRLLTYYRNFRNLP